MTNYCFPDNIVEGIFVSKGSMSRLFIEHLIDAPMNLNFKCWILSRVSSASIVNEITYNITVFHEYPYIIKILFYHNILYIYEMAYALYIFSFACIQLKYVKYLF